MSEACPSQESLGEAVTDSELLKTIKLSKNVFKLSLPQANYD